MGCTHGNKKYDMLLLVVLDVMLALVHGVCSHAASYGLKSAAERSVAAAVSTVLVLAQVLQKWPIFALVGVAWFSMAQVEAVQCISCHDAIPNCLGGTSCPYHSVPFINQNVLHSEGGSYDQTIPGTDDAEERVVTHTVLAITMVLPRVIARFLPRGVLDFFKTVARRPPWRCEIELRTS